ncbi:hypothetical protein C8A01DRAFT_31464 [Parachaetomium inaequale]|uniref:Uncharacterized protein n=1 Tax=Parachaetomium inaequale TaxID=2588326 RepID=A0AAN6PNV4_9PEZI|nr:hypothetical protein C8A01DRAFT_31464 [Parachaetomium inaequale]
MAAMYTHMQPQEELVALFSRNLTLDPLSRPAPTPAPAPVEEPQEERKIIYISQHYNHSAHIAKHDAQPPRPASEPPQSEHAEVERVLREHSVDPTGLSSAQLQLFKMVDTPEKLRLLELWRVCPPTNNSTADNPTLTWSTTTVDQEEALARLRFEQQQQHLIDQQLAQEFGMMQDEPEPEAVMSLDGTPLTPIQAGDGRWIAMSSASAAASSYHYVEPYMASGYEEMARREYEDSVRRAYAEAVAPPPSKENSSLVAAAPAGAGGMPTFNPSHADPVYKTTNGGWEAAMADQYGRIMAMREDEEML